MKNAHPYTGKWLREWFPEQTKNIPTILCWTVVYILDVVLVFWVANLLGIHILELPNKLITVMSGLYLVIALVIFWVETQIYNRITAAIRKSRDPY